MAHFLEKACWQESQLQKRWLWQLVIITVLHPSTHPKNDNVCTLLIGNCSLACCSTPLQWLDMTTWVWFGLVLCLCSKLWFGSLQSLEFVLVLLSCLGESFYLLADLRDRVIPMLVFMVFLVGMIDASNWSWHAVVLRLFINTPVLQDAWILAAVWSSSFWA